MDSSQLPLSTPLLTMNLLEKCTENQEEKDCQWSKINVIITKKVTLLYVEVKFTANHLMKEMY